MKIGILTFHRANNLGAVLQASALLNYLQSLGCDCEIIDFIPNNAIDSSGYIKKFLRFVKKIIIFPKSHRNYKREKRFENYRLKYYSLSRETYYGDEDIRKKQINYDILISGSDQILNTTLTGNSKSFYLSFASVIKKVSYASSFGRTNITKLERELIKSEFSNFDAISVREESAKDIVFQETGRNSQLVVDPVFLLSKDEWCKRCNEEISLPKKYIFVYSMEVSPVLEYIVKKISDENNLPVIVVRGGGKASRIIGKEDFSCGPAEFLRYIRDAALIVTNSFHGIAVSLIYGKKFVAIAHSKRNARIENILKLSKVEQMLLPNNFEKELGDDYIINGQEAFEKLTECIDVSKEFLKKNCL